MISRQIIVEKLKAYKEQTNSPSREELMKIIDEQVIQIEELLQENEDAETENQKLMNLVETLESEIQARAQTERLLRQRCSQLIELSKTIEKQYMVLSQH